MDRISSITGFTLLPETSAIMMPGGDKSGGDSDTISNLAVNTGLSICKYNYRSSIDPVAGTAIIIDAYLSGA